MKKEKTVRTYQRRTKSGKIVTVRQHTAKYDAAEALKEAAKKKGAGDELEALKKNSVKDSKDPYSAHGFTKDEFNEWYEGTGSVSDKKVAKALRKTLGRKAYNELSDLAADNYKKGGASSFFKKNIHSKTAETKTSNRTKKGAAISKRMTLDEYLGSKGLSSPVSDFMIDKTKLPHGLTQRGKEKLRKEADKAANEHQEKRAAAIKEYKKLVKEGKIVAPTSSEQLNKIAEGHPDNASTQAAKRVLEKRAAKTEKANDYTIVKGPGMMGGDFAVKDGKAYTRDVTKKNPKWKPMKEWTSTAQKVLEYYEALQDTSMPLSKLKRKTSTKTSSTTSTTGAGADWSKATVDKIGREHGGGYTIVGTPNDGLWGSTNFRTKSQALDFIKRKQKESSANKSSASKANAPTKKPLASYQKHAINALLNQPGWSMSKAEKYVRTLSDKEVQRLAHKDM